MAGPGAGRREGTGAVRAGCAGWSLQSDGIVAFTWRLANPTFPY